MRERRCWPPQLYHAAQALATIPSAQAANSTATRAINGRPRGAPRPGSRATLVHTAVRGQDAHAIEVVGLAEESSQQAPGLAHQDHSAAASHGFMDVA